MATIAQDKSIQHRSEVSITVYVKGLDSGYSRSDRYIEFYDARSDYLGKTTVDAYASVSDTVTLTDSSWEADSNYIITGTAYYTDNGVWKSSPLSAVYLTAIAPSSGGGTDPDPDEPTEKRISRWYWDTDIHAGLPVSEVRFTEWNSLIDKIKELLDTGHYDSWLTKSSEGAILSMKDSRIDSSNKTLTAAKFNSVRFNISSRFATGISKVSKGDPVLAEYFDTLERSINKWIDEYNYDYTR